MLTHKTKMTNAKYDISIGGHCEYEDVSMKLTINDGKSSTSV